MKYSIVKKLFICILSVSITSVALAGCGNHKNEAAAETSSVSSESATTNHTIKAGDALAESSGEEAEASIEQGQKYLENLDYDNAILEFSKIIKNDRHNVKAYAGLYAAYMAKCSENEAANVIDDMKKANVSEEDMIEAVLDMADTIPDTEDANIVRNGIGYVAMEDNYTKLAEKAFKTVLATDEKNKDATEGLKQLAKKEDTSNSSDTKNKDNKTESDTGTKDNSENSSGNDSTPSGSGGSNSDSGSGNSSGGISSSTDNDTAGSESDTSSSDDTETTTTDKADAAETTTTDETGDTGDNSDCEPLPDIDRDEYSVDDYINNSIGTTNDQIESSNTAN